MSKDTELFNRSATGINIATTMPMFAEAGSCEPTTLSLALGDKKWDGTPGCDPDTV